MPKPISHQRYLAAVSTLTKVVRVHVVSLVEDDLWKFHSVHHLGDIEDSVSDHLETDCRTCRQDDRDSHDRLPGPECEFLAACIVAVRRLNPTVRTAVSLFGLRQSPLLNIAERILRKYFRDSSVEVDPSGWGGFFPDELTAAQINHVLDILWPHIRTHVPEEISPVSRRRT
jgi:hypothetical protein